MSKKFTLRSAVSLAILGSIAICQSPAWAIHGNNKIENNFVSTQISYQGIVKNTAGEALPGATVVILGTQIAVITDEKGQFTLSADPQQTIRISLMGYQSLEKTLSTAAQLEIILEDDFQALNEVVVVGYGTQKKVNLSGAVDQVSSKVLEDRPINNISQGLQGLIPNLNIQFNSGAPGESAQINVRGITSINGGDPLIMIDGVQGNSEDLNLIAPQDIENITVIKDASAAAIYGARAAFGVILITTKAGNIAGSQISYSNNFTWNTPTVFGDKITDPYIFSRLLETSTDNTPWDNVNYSDQYYQYAKERSDNPKGTDPVRINPTLPNQWEYMGNQDWARFFLNDFNHSNNHDLSINGRSENQKARYYLSGGYNKQNSPLNMADDYFDRYSIRSKVDYKIFDFLSVGNNTTVTQVKRQSPSQYSLFDIHNIFPTDHYINPDGTWANNTAGRTAAKLVDGGEVKDQRQNMQTQFTAESNFFNGLLKLNADYTYRQQSRNRNSYQTKYTIGFGPDDLREEGINSASRTSVFDYYKVFNIYATLFKEFNRHSLSGVIGFNQEEFRSERIDASKTGLISSSLPTLGLATGDATANETVSTYALRGAFFRLNYVFSDKYIVEFNGRYDGSSRFPKNKRFGFFPSGSVAWRIDQENFMENLRSEVSNLKLRASYGTLGNQSVSNYGYIPTMNTGLLNYLIDDSRPYYISTPGLVSPLYTWEKVNTLNFGLDVGLFNEKISSSFDYYVRNTLDMLTLSKELPAVLGASEPRENAADLRTQGWEFSLAYRDRFDLGSESFNWNTRFVLSDSWSEITRFDNPDNSITQYYKGMKLGEIWGLESDGVFRSAEEIAQLDQTAIIPWGALSIVEGWPKYVDQDGNGKIEKGYTLGDTKDLKIIGNNTARYQFGVDFSADWKGFDFRMFWQGVAKRDYYPIDYLYWGHFQQPYGNTFNHLLDFYRAENDSDINRSKHSQSYLDAGLADQNLDAKYPHLQSWLADANLGLRIDQSMGAAIPQTAYLLDASYIRLKNLTFGYTLPTHLTKKAGVSKARIYVSGENILEFSQLKKYFDPETTNANIQTNPGVNTGRSGNGMTYPFQRSYSFGINLIF